MKCLITGGCGFIGSHIAEELRMNDHDVIILDDFSTGNLQNVVGVFPLKNVFNADVRNYDDIRKHFDGVDYVFHEAAAKMVHCANDPYRDLMVNAWGTYNVIKASVDAGVKKIIHASTGSINNYDPKCFYGVSKAAAEGYYRVQDEIDYTILRYYHVYGPKQSTTGMGGGVVSIFARNFLNGDAVDVHGGSQVRCLTYVKDVVQANIIAMEQGSKEIIPVPSDERVSIISLACKMEGITGSKSKIVTKPYRKNELMDFNINNSRIKQLGLVFSDFEERLRETIEYVRTH